MPAPIPARTQNVFFVGAGLSSALGLPNTPSLIRDVLEFAKQKSWLASEALPDRLEEAFRFFYPDATHPGFQPDVVDFFSALRTYIDVGAGLRGTGLKNAPELFRSLKFAISHLIIERVRAIDEKLRSQDHDYLSRMIDVGNTIITSNWDFVIERYAQARRIPLRLSIYGQAEVVLLKLHGSIDWCRVEDRSHGRSDADYSSLRELLFSPRSRRLRPPRGKNDLARIRALENWGDAWRRVKSRASSLHMVTMVRGKSGDLGPLQPIWRDAYSAMSRARRLEIVGYSMPDDDIEIRTLLRTGIERGPQSPQLVVKNPSPDVHNRVRQFLDRQAQPDYLPVNAFD
jgi:hypothetical protein